MHTQNPFVGLRPFESSDSLFYFGRESETKQLLQKLYLNHFVAVIGSSGSGKSSLVRAGVMPRLEGGFLVQDRDKWKIAKFKPGNRPLTNLASALANVCISTSDRPQVEVIRNLTSDMSEKGVSSIKKFLKPLLDKSDFNLFILVDQFEELFRFGTGKNTAIKRQEAEEFVDLLLALKNCDLPIYICITMRSDFIGDCDAFYGLPEAVSKSQFLVPRLTRQKRQEVITHPITLCDATITPRLVDRLLNEDIDTRDDLPVLQHVLMRTWDAWAEEGSNDPLDIKDYEKVQTIHNALNAHALEAWTELNPQQKSIAVKMFKLLTAVDANNRRIRHPTSLQTISNISEAKPEAVLAVIEKFLSKGRAFLTLSPDTKNGSRLVDISHESLIRQWKALAKWVDEEAESAKVYERLTERALRHKKHEANLYTGLDLARVKSWHKTIPEGDAGKVWSLRYNQNFEDAIQFLSDSVRAEEAKDTAPQKKLHDEYTALQKKLSEAMDLNYTTRKSLQFWRRTTIFIGVVSSLFFSSALVVSSLSELQIISLGLILLVSTLLSIAVYKKQSVQKTNEDTEYKNLRYEFDKLSHEKDACEKKLASIEMYEKNANDKMLEALELKKQAESDIENVSTKQKKTKSIIREAKEAKAVADTIFSISLKDKAELAIEKSQRFSVRSTDYQTEVRHALIYTLEVLSKNSQQVIPSDQTLDYLYSIDTSLIIDNHEKLLAANHESAITAVAYCPNRSTIAFSSDRNETVLKCATTGEVIHRLKNHIKQVTSITYNNVGNILASGSDDTTVCLWCTKTGELLHSLDGHLKAVIKIAFSPDGTMIASGSEDGNVHIWDTDTGELKYILKLHTGTVLSLAFHPDGNSLASGSEDGTLCHWNVYNGKIISQIPCHSGIPLSLSYSPDGKCIAYGSHKGATVVLDAKNGNVLKKLTDQKGLIRSIIFSPNGEELASASSDSSIYLWDTESGYLSNKLYGHSGSVNTLTYDLTGTILISGSSDKTVRIWQVKPADIMYRILNNFNHKITSEALQHLWNTKLDGLSFVDNYPSSSLTLSENYRVTDSQIEEKYLQLHGTNKFTETKVMHLLSWLEKHSRKPK